MFSRNLIRYSNRILRSGGRINRLSTPQKQPLVRWTTAAATNNYDEQDTTTKRLDAFEVMNLDRKFDLSPDELKASYRNLMATLHPDKHHNKSLEEQESLQQQASQVIQSYQILKEAPTRATHMLQLVGKIDDMDESTMKELLGGAQGNVLLMEVMELREAIDEAGSSREELQPMLDNNTARMEQLGQQLAKAFQEDDWDQALELTVKLQYYNRIDETIRAKLD